MIFISEILYKLLGLKQSDSLEYRFYKILVVTGIGFNVYALVINTIVGNPYYINLISIVTGIFIFAVYRATEKSRNYLLSVNILLFMSTFLVYPSLWFLMGGSLGVGPYFLIMHSIIITILLGITGRKHFIISHLSIVVLVLVLEYMFPQLVMEYAVGVPRILSVGVSLLMICFSSSFLVLVIMNEYNKTIKQLHEIQSNLKTANSELKVRAFTDELSGLFNRRFMISKLNEIASQGNVAVILFDIDFFKKVNDTYGHGMGDTVIQKVSQLLEENVRKDDYCGRIGGEEFLVLLPTATSDEAYKRAEQIRKKVEQQAWDIPELKVTISGGVYASSSHEQAEDILKSTDTFLYKAKNAGRNRIAK